MKGKGIVMRSFEREQIEKLKDLYREPVNLDQKIRRAKKIIHETFALSDVKETLFEFVQTLLRLDLLKYPDLFDGILQEGCTLNNLELIKFALEHGADPNKKYSHFNFEVDSKTPLETACENESLEAMKLLIENGADFDRTDEDGCTLLMRCFMTTKQILYFHRYGFVIDAYTDPHYTQKRFFAKQANLLIQSGASVYIVNNAGETVFDIIKKEHPNYSLPNIVEANIDGAIRCLDIDLFEKNTSIFFAQLSKECSLNKTLNRTANKFHLINDNIIKMLDNSKSLADLKSDIKNIKQEIQNTKSESRYFELDEINELQQNLKLRMDILNKIHEFKNNLSDFANSLIVNSILVNKDKGKKDINKLNF